jgi:O-antigen ligase
MMIRDPRPLLLTGLLAALLLWSPIPFGSVNQPARGALQLGAAVALMAAAACRGSGAWRASAVPALALLLVAAWGALQAAPLPRALVARISPEAAELRADATTLLEAALPERVPLSLAPDLSRSSALWWAALGAAFAAAAVAGRDRRHRRVLVLALMAAAAFQVLYGMRRWTAGASLIWGVTVPSGAHRLRGTFVNPDHLALFLELPLAVGAAWIWWAVRKARAAVSPERRLLLVAPPMMLWLAWFAAIAFTGSRAGMVAAVAATVGLGVAVALRARRWRLAPAGVGLSLLGIAAVAGLGLQQGLGRWLATTPYDVSWGSRRLVYEATLELWQRFPWTGSGMATFRSAFPLVAPGAVGGGWWHAHNDWLEALATLGVPGALLLLVGLAAVVQRLFTILGSTARSEDRAAALAAYGALVGAAVHSALDFGLTIPANALALTLLVGAAVGAPAHPTAEAVEPRRRRASRRAERSRRGPDDAVPRAGDDPPPPGLA